MRKLWYLKRGIIKMEVTKVSKNLGTLIIKEVEYNIAKDIIVKNHYSKKWNTSFGKVNIGIFKDNKLLGVAVFGNLMNPNSHSKITDLGRSSVIELNRLWIDDELGHNAETILLGASFKIIKHSYPHIKFVQSFADGRLGCGTIYKASNFKYYGYSKSLFFEDVETGEVFHKVPLENTKRPQGFLVKNKRYLEGKLKPFYVKTYRYIYPLDKKEKCKLEEKEYPKYEKGIVETVFKHPNSLLCRLYIMYNEIGEYKLRDKCFNEVINELKEKDKINNIMDKQKENESVKWFKKEYLGNDKNKEKIINMLTQK